MTKDKDYTKRKPEGHSRLERTDMEAQSWVYAPTRLSIQIVGADGDVLSLTEQQILQGIHAKLQPYIRRYFSLPAEERKEEYGSDENRDRFQPLFRSTKEGAQPDTPTMEFDATEIVDRAHFAQLRQYANKMLNIKVDIKASEDILDENGTSAKSGRNLPLEYRHESIFPLFSKITLETTGEKHDQLTRAKDGEQGEIKSYDTYTGKMVAKINPEISNYVFNMRAGVIEQPRFLAKYAKCKYTPIFYALLKRQIGINRVDTVAFDYMHVKRWANLPPDEVGPRRKDANGKSIAREWHNLYSQFRRRVLEEVRYDLIQMCERNHSDMYMDYEPVYRTPGNHKSNPDKIRFFLFLSYVGERRNEYKKTRKLEPSLFAEQEPAAAISGNTVGVHTDEYLHKGEGKELWNKLLSDYDGPVKPLLMRAKYIGLDGGKFYSKMSRRDFNEWFSVNDREVERMAKQLLGITSPYIPAFVFSTIDVPE